MVFIILICIAFGGLSYGSTFQEERDARHSAARSLEWMRRVMDQFHASFWVYQDSGSAGNHFFEWMKFPDEKAAVDISGSWTETKYSGATAIRCTFWNLNGRNYGGFLFQNGILKGDDKAPKENFGTEANAGLNLTGATQLSFWARGENGGEVVRFFMGGIGWDTTGFLRRPQKPCTEKVEGPCPYPDSTPKVMIQSVLTREWKKYVIDLKGRDLHYVLGGFGWYADAVSNPEGAVFYVDDIQYELDDSARNKRLQQPRFLLSYQTESDPQDQSIVGRFDLAQRNTAYTYDNALALLAFLADGTPDSIRRARLIGDAFVWASRHDRTFTDGRLRSAYQAGDVDLPSGWLPHDRPGTARVPGFYNEAPDFHLSPDEIIDLPALARQLLAGDSPDLKRIRSGLSDETVRMLAKYAVYPASVLPDCSCWSLNKPKMPTEEDLKPLIRDLNLLIDKNILRPPDAPAKGAPALQLSQRLAWARQNRAALDRVFPQELLASQSFIEVRQEAIDSGDNAWTTIALLALYQASHDAQYLETAKRIGEFLEKFKNEKEGYQGFLGGIDSPEKKSSEKTPPQNGPTENESHQNDNCPRPWASTEHNLDVYAAFTRLFQITADERWRNGAAHARRFVEAMWDDDPQDKEQRGCFLAGTLDTRTRNTAANRLIKRPEDLYQLPLDTQSWSVLSLKNILETHPDLLRCPERNHLVIKTAGSQAESYSGFDFNEDKDGIWVEGTAQMAVAYKFAGRADQSAIYQKELRRIQQDPSLGKNDGSLPAALQEPLTSGFDFNYFRRPHVGATAWNVFAQLGFNPYYQELK